MTDFDQNGVLYLVATPIGNLEDITLRALRILKESDIIAAEDTRRSGLLLKHFNINGRLESYYDFNKTKKTPILLNQLIQGRSIALISDAGTPGISDPAYYLARRAIEKDIPVVSIPGPTAAISALIVSGLPTDRFVFEGFLPVKKGRQTRLQNLKTESRTIILYESPHRLLRTLTDIIAVMGDRIMAVCRELTKKFEEIQRGKTSELHAYFSERKIKGEFVLIIKGYKINEKK